MSWKEVLKAKGKPVSAYKRKLKRARKKMKEVGLDGFNDPKALRNDSGGKSHHVYAKEGTKLKYIKFGEAGADTVTEKNPSPARKKKKKRFKSRHGKNIKRGKMSAAYWSDKVKW